MNPKKILVIGYFGYRSNQLDGQTVKTRCILELLKSHENELGEIKYYDTQEFRYKKSSLLLFFKLLASCNKIVIVPADRNLDFVFPMVFIFSGVFRYDIIHIGIGGWLDDYFKRRPLQRYMARKIKANLMENISVCDNLSKDFGFNNTRVMPNFRIHNHNAEISDNNGNLRIVYMSRIQKKKGLDIIFQIAEYISRNFQNDSIRIDFYGAVLDEDKPYFQEWVEKYDFLCYYGELLPDKIHSKLSEYDLLILPTRYYTEGFPGAVLDAYISGIPVLVSNWKHAHEYVENGVSGYICDVNHTDQFIQVIEELFRDRNKLTELKNGAFRHSKKYTKENAYLVLKEFLS
jgi:glycosyltransferase involved in cell wall biosynthesis